MSNWAEDPQLYLYTKGVDVYLWRCNEAKDSMLMKMEDFDDLGKVTNHLDLVGGNASIFNWERHNYINLVKYISSMHLLVNSHGLVIVEHNKYTEDGKVNDNQSPVYLRALDVLPLERFNLRERTIPPRTARYLEGDGTRDASVVEVTNVQQDLSNVEKRVTNLEGIVNTEKNLEGIVTKLTGDLAVRMNGLEASLQELVNLVKSTNEAMDTKITELQVKDETFQVLDWMNDFTDSNWVGIEKVHDLTHNKYVVTVIGPRGTYSVDDNKSNVRAGYFYRVTVSGLRILKAVAIEDLNLGKENARFSKEVWSLSKYKGITYVFRNELYSDIRNFSDV